MDVHAEKPVGTRLGLAAVMLLVLAAAVAAAAWIVDARGGAVERGQAVLESLRTRLPALLDGNGEELWYLGLTTTGRPVGWEMDKWQKAPGGYEGISLLAMEQVRQAGPTRSAGRAVFREQWSLSADGRSGQYIGYEGAGPGQHVLTTKIELDGGKVTVTQMQDGQRLSASAAAPKAYVPEGLGRLAIRLAVAGGREVRFTMLYNQEAIDKRRQVHFGSMDVEPLGNQRARLTHVAGPETAWQDEVAFDEQGRLTAAVRGGGGVVFRLVTREQVVRIFPEANAVGKAKVEAEAEEAAPGGDATE